MDPAVFYDGLADYYHLIYADWEGSMRRHGAAISAMLGVEPSAVAPGRLRILDASAGIGTQALPLASLGFEVVARDLSANAIARLGVEAAKRGLAIDAAQADMRQVADSVSGQFDAVLAFDNSIPHLLSDSDICAALQEFRRLLKPGGCVLISVRDYAEVDRSRHSSHDYGERLHEDRRFRIRQEWAWRSASHYRLSMVFEEFGSEDWSIAARAEAEYYAVGIPRLLELMQSVGLLAHRVDDVPFFQPVLRGRAG